MLRTLIRSFRTGALEAKTIQVLQRTYNLTVNHPTHRKMIKRISQGFSESYNEHEMAVQFLAEFSEIIQIDHLQAKREVEKYVRFSKSAYNRGLIKSDRVMEQLFKVAKMRFNINPDDIEAI